MSTFYVSQAAANGIPAGNDATGDGSRDRPWASVDRANAAAANGDTVLLNDGVYTPARDLRMTNSVSWLGVRDYGATIRAAAGQTRIVTVADEQAGTVTLGKIVLDGANTSRSLIALGDSNVPYGLTLEGTRLVNPTSFGIQGGALTRVNLVTNGVEFTASAALSMLYLSALHEGNVAIYGGKVSIAGQYGTGHGGIASIDADAVGPSVTISGVKADINATAGDGIHYGIRLKDVANAVVEYNDITQTQTGTGTTFIGATVHVSYEQAEPLNASGGVIRYNTLRNYLAGGAGKIILVGADSDPGVPLQDNANDFQIYGNSLFGNAASQASDLHGILVGWQDGASVYNNSVDYAALAYVLKGMSGDTQVYNNLATRTLSKAYYQKGGTGVDFLYNSSYNKESFKPVGVAIGDFGVNEFPANDATVVGNSVYYSGSPGTFLTLSPGSSITTLRDNKYYGNGSYANGPWQYDGVKYTSLAAWQAGRESSASSATGATLGMGAILGAVSLSGPALTEGGMVGGRHTYYVTFVDGVAATTSFAVANLGVGSAAKISGRIDVNDSGGSITSSSLSGSGTVDTLYGPLSAGGRTAFTVSYDGKAGLSDQVLAVFGNYSTTFAYNIVFRTLGGSAAAPTIAGASTRSMNDVQTVSPFSGVTISDADVTSQKQVTVRQSDAANGGFSTLAGFTSLGGGQYSLSGTVGQINAALRDLEFTPTANQVAPGQTVTTSFAITYVSGGSVVTDSVTATTALSINDTPVIAGVVTDQSVTENAEPAIFARTSIADPDPGQVQRVSITLDAAGRGTLGAGSGFVAETDGVTYTYTGPAAAATAALRALTFTPAKHQAVPGSSVVAKVILNVSDGVTPARAGITYVTIQAVETAPTLAGAAESSITDAQTVNPFAAMTVTDPDRGARETLTVRVDDAAKGGFTALAGFTRAADGSLTFTGVPGAAQAALQGLVFQPVGGRLAAGASETATFTVTAFDGTATATSPTTVRVSGSGGPPQNTAPVLSGVAANQAMLETASLQPFAGITLSDPDAGQTQSVSVALDTATRGSFTALGGFVGGGNGSYSYTGSAANAQAALRGLVFEPNQHQVVPGSSSTARISVTSSDGAAASNIATANVAVTAVQTAPTLAGAAATSITDAQTSKPFTTMTVSDPDKSASETLTVRADDPAKGGFTTFAGFTRASNGSLTFTGSPGAAQSALRQVVFTPIAGRLAAGASETATFTVTAFDGAATATDSATTVQVRNAATPNTAPVVSGVAVEQAILETATLQPFGGITLTDPDAEQTQSVTVALDAATSGSFTTLSGFTDAGNGTLGFTGSAASAQSALRGLVFAPTRHQAVPGSSTTARITVTSNDGAAASGAGVTSVAIQAVETAPTLAGAATTSITDAQSTQPFAAMLVADPDRSADETLTVRVDDPAKGGFTTLAGFTRAADGSLTFQGAPGAAQSALRALVFQPASGRLAAGASETASFTVTAFDGTATATDSATTVRVNSAMAPTQNTVPVLSGVAADQAVLETATLKPFTGITLADPDAGQSQTVTITLDKVTRGTFTTLAGFTDGGTGSIQFIGGAADAQAAMRSLVFTPKPYQVVPGSSFNARMTVTSNDGVATSAAAVTDVAITAVQNAPVLAGARTSNINEGTTVKPFSSMTLTDPDKNAAETVLVRFDDAAKGGFTTLGGFTAATGGGYSFTGTPGSAQSALRSLAFKPTSNRLAPGGVETTSFSVSVSDGAATALNEATRVVTTFT